MKTIVIAALAFTLLAVSCAGAPGGSAAEREVTISLDGNATTGYRWTYDAADLAGIVAEVSNNYTAPNTGRMGSGGVFTFTFRGVKEGETVVRFRYERPWESGAAPARVAVYRMAVDRAGNITVREEQG